MVKKKCRSYRLVTMRHLDEATGREGLKPIIGDLRIPVRIGERLVLGAERRVPINYAITRELITPRLRQVVETVVQRAGAAIMVGGMA